MKKTPASTLLAGLAPAGCFDGEDVELVTTDSRELRPGCIFVAFPGQRFDGHAFAAEAIEKGAVCVVLNHPVPGVPEEKTVLCPDSYRAMMSIGANYRAQFSPRMIGVTGSVGKTTTKEFCCAVLSAFGRTVKTEGNQNNELGLPRTLLRMDDTTEFAVVEMGMSNLGEIDRLARCAHPAAGIITCIGVSHLENLGTRENILKAKLEICAGLPDGAPLALNADDAYLRGAHLPEQVQPVWYALNCADADVDIRAENLQTTPEGTTRFALHDKEHGSFAVEIPALGTHIVYDALAAYSAATRLGLDAARTAAALSQFRQTGMRQHLVKCGGVDIIEDCYNANPDSMRAALEMFRDYPCAHRIALLGDMLELGSVRESAHREAGRQCAAAGVDCLVAYGEAAALIAGEARKAGVPVVIEAASHAEAAEALRENAKPGDAVLAKGSRGMALEKALELFYAELNG